MDRTEIDGTIKKKVQSWINKKIIEYIGEPEPTLVDFICSKLLAGSTPQSILDDVKMVRNDIILILDSVILMLCVNVIQLDIRRGSRHFRGEDVAADYFRS